MGKQTLFKISANDKTRRLFLAGKPAQKDIPDGYVLLKCGCCMGIPRDMIVIDMFQDGKDSPEYSLEYFTGRNEDEYYLDDFIDKLIKHRDFYKKYVDEWKEEGNYAKTSREKKA